MLISFESNDFAVKFYCQTFKFRKVVWQQILSEMLHFISLCLWMPQWTNYENRLLFAEVSVHV